MAIIVVFLQWISLFYTTWKPEDALTDDEGGGDGSGDNPSQNDGITEKNREEWKAVRKWIYEQIMYANNDW